jgi:hypothetical protein
VYAVDPVQGLMGGPEASVSRQAGSLPFPGKPVGTVNEEMPFDHVVVVMMENHSFDNLLGGLALTRLDVDGLTFVDGKATNSNLGVEGTPSVVTAFPLPTLRRDRMCRRAGRTPTSRSTAARWMGLSRRSPERHDLRHALTSQHHLVQLLSPTFR